MSEKEKWNTYRTRFLVRARQLTQPLVFTDSFGREHSGQPGDYLVETCDGIRRITSRNLFEDIYVLLAPEAIAPPAVSVQKRPAREDVARSAPQVAIEERQRASA